MLIIASVLSVFTVSGQIHQIIRNLKGKKGSWLPPLMAIINNLAWMSYFITVKQLNELMLFVYVYAIILATINFLTSINEFRLYKIN